MKRLCLVLMTMAAVLGLAAVASAQDMPPQGPPPGGGFGGGGPRQRLQFADLDKNKDKKLSRDEWPSFMPPQTFDAADTNHDGFVDEAEWNAMRQRFGGGGGRGFGENIIKFLDADKDGKVTREEFARLLTLFDILDQNHDGALTQDELNGFFRALNEAQTQATGGVEVNNLFTKFDKNKDGKLTPDEFTDARMFRALDLNKDGAITRDEAETALKQMAERAKAKKQQP
jgi:Ca2+-binding EF-hand superfamily protein